MDRHEFAVEGRALGAEDLLALGLPQSVARDDPAHTVGCPKVSSVQACIVCGRWGSLLCYILRRSDTSLIFSPQVTRICTSVKMWKMCIVMYMLEKVRSRGQATLHWMTKVHVFFVLQHHFSSELENALDICISTTTKKEFKIRRHIAQLYALNPVLLSIFCLNHSLWWQCWVLYHD